MEDVVSVGARSGADRPGDDGVRVTTVVRRQRILDRLQEQESVTVKDLAGEFGMTEMSLRRDLNALAETGQIVRTRGGARRSRTSTGSRHYIESEQRNVQAKAKIAQAAARLLRGERSAFFYSGSTVARVAVALEDDQRDDLAIVTPSLPVINEVSSWPDPHLVIVGGLFLPNYMTAVGPQAVESLQAISADVAVVGCDGISAEGLATPHQLVAEIGSVIVQRARRTIVVADSSKIGRRGFTSIAPLAAVHTVITDEGADQATLRAFAEQGIDVQVV